MKHDWSNTILHLVFAPKRKCHNCGVEQVFTDLHYDRVSGTRKGWRPLVGRCKPKQNGAPAERLPPDPRERSERE